MADRYWVAGGTGNYNSTTNWSATSGGASGVSVGTASFGNPHALIDIQNQLQQLLISKGFTSLKSAIGYAHRTDTP